ncbi:MAG: hypothetical protein H6757_05175 [Candidatus Omnitrophica bacterium]|nr:hypothetical protein [Candidatus Omnitrophota bacterium]
MATHFEKDASIPVKAKVFLKPAINRFFRQKYTRWTKQDVMKIMDVTELEAILMGILKEWESQGWIKLMNQGNCLFQVLMLLPEEKHDDENNGSFDG